MGWSQPPSEFKSGKLDGLISATHFVLTPNDKKLKQHELQLNVQSISGFELHRVKVGEDSTENQLHFQIVTVQDGSAAQVEQYVRQIGLEQGQLRVNYDKQDPLPLDGTEDPQGKLDTGDATATTEAPGEGETEDGEASDEPADGPAVASATTMGGTHQKRAPRGNRSTVN